MSAIIADYNARVNAVLAKNEYEIEKKITERMHDDDEVVGMISTGTAACSPIGQQNIGSSMSFVVGEASYIGGENSSILSNPSSPRREGSPGTTALSPDVYPMEDLESSLAPTSARVPSPRSHRRIDFSARTIEHAEGDSMYQVSHNIHF